MSRFRSLKRISEALLLCVAMHAPAAQGEDGVVGMASVGLAPDRQNIASPATSNRRDADVGGIPLFLSVNVNGMDLGLARFELIGEEIWATRVALTSLGLRTEGDNPDEFVRVQDATGGKVSYDAPSQSISFMVAPTKLAVATSRLNSDNQDRPIAQSATGAVLNYDAYANYSGDRLSLDAFTEARVFSGKALLESTTLLRHGQVGANNVVRLDTTAAISFPSRRLTLRAGDLISRGTSWSRPVRLGGMRFGTDFALQPYIVTAPIPSFFGEAALPSTVDLYVNGIKRYSGEVTPGPFEIGAGPNHINGAGEAQVVVTDALGQVTALDFPIYDTPLLLRKGLSDWSVEVGAVRENYGIRSFDYASEISASASWRSGLTDRLTLDLHAEAAGSLVNGGVGASLLLPIGVVSSSLAASTSDGKSGGRVELGYSFNASSFNLAATVQRASDDFADLASVNGAQPVLARDMLTLGYNSERFGTFGLGVFRQRQKGDQRARYFSFNWYKSLGRQLSFGLSANLDLETASRKSAFFSLTYTPGNRDQASLSVHQTERRTSLAAGYRRSLPYEGGTGWAIDGNYDGETFQAAGQVDRLGPHGQATAGLRMHSENVAGYAGYSGALVFMGGDLFASRKIFDGFAVVSTNGIADVPVRLQNREVGQTNDHGYLLVTGLNSYQTNEIRIDPSKLPSALSVDRLTEQAVPAGGAGALVVFPIMPTKAILMTLVDENGLELPVGSIARESGAAVGLSVVGFDGQLYIEEANPGALISVENEAGVCEIRVPQSLDHALAGRLGKLVCRKQQ